MPTICYTHMSAEEREPLSLGQAHGHSLRTMAMVLGRASSTVSREHAPAQRGADRIVPARPRRWQRIERVSHGGRANSWIPGCGSMAEPTWLKAARPRVDPYI